MDLEVKMLNDAHAQVIVTLSRRNLLAMLHKLDMPGSFRRIEKDFGDTETALTLTLIAEDDADHYGPGKTAGMFEGPMHPDTEAFIRDSQ